MKSSVLQEVKWMLLGIMIVVTMPQVGVASNNRLVPNKVHTEPVDSLYSKGKAAYDRADYIQAFHYFEQAAQRGHILSQSYLASM